MVILLDRTAQATTTCSHTSRSLSSGIHAENESHLFIECLSHLQATFVEGESVMEILGITSQRSVALLHEYIL